MTVPVLNSVGEDLYERLAPLTYDDANQGYALAHYLNAVGLLVSEINDYVRDDGENPGWSSLLDPMRAPTKGMQWLGQLAGASFLPQGLSESEATYRARAQAVLLADAGLQRGTPGAMAAAAQQYLTGTKTVYVRERDSSPYHLTINTRLLETPTDDWAAANYFQNGGFEINTTPWVAQGTGTTIARDTTMGRFGTSSLKVTTTASGPMLGARSGNNVAAASTQYTVSGYFYSVAGGERVAIRVNEYNSVPTFIQATDSATVTLVPGWQRVTYTLTSTGTTAFLDVTFGTSALGANQAVSFWLDGLQMEINPAASPYIETTAGGTVRGPGNGPVGAALRAAKPAGLVMTYVPIPGQDWQNVLNTRATWNAVLSAYSTWDAVRTG